MKLARQQACELLAKHGCYVTEACDRCGRLLGPVTYTRKGEPGEWCSRECRGDAERTAIRKGGRPRKYKRDDERVRAARRQNAKRQEAFRARAGRNGKPLAGVQRNGKPPRTFAGTKNLPAPKTALSYYPSSGALGGSTA